MSANDDDTPAAKSATDLGTTTESHQGNSVDNTEDEPRADSEPARAASTDVGAASTASAKANRDEPDSTPYSKLEEWGDRAWNATADWLGSRGALPALAIITIAVFAIHANIFTGETDGDDLTFHFAESARLMDCLRSGDFDFWNPSANGGYASAYYYQVLPQLASAVPAAIFGHHLFWFQLSVVLPLVLAPACAYKGMRLLGATPWQSTLAAFCVAFMNGESIWGAGNASNFEVGLYTQTWSLCALPIALGYAAQWMMRGTHLAAAIAWGTFVFLCHPFGGITLGFAVFAAWCAQVVLLPFDYLFAAIGPALHGKLARLGRRWEQPPRRTQTLVPELVRGAILAVGFGIAWLPIWLPLVIDGAGFGGFPHRRADEVGPGFINLWSWFSHGMILDWISPKSGYTRFIVLTWALPVVLLFARAKYFRWLWPACFLFALLLGVGPHISKIGDDLFPPVRFLGGMQTLLAMGIGAGALVLGTHVWKWCGRWQEHGFWLRTGLVCASAVAIVLIALPGGRALGHRARVLDDFTGNNPDELRVMNEVLAKLPPGRKQPAPGAENHWWNLLPYAYKRVPTTLQQGGGGLQASPNYDFLWHNHDQHRKTAWIFDAPYVTFRSSLGKHILGETIAKTFNFELRKLASPGLVSPVRVMDTLPPGYSHDEPGHQAALKWYKSDQPLRDEVLAYAGDTGNRAAPSGHATRWWRQESPGSDADIMAELDVAKTTTFTVRESWHPRWHAYIDDEEVPVRRVTPDFIAVDVPAGTHTLAMRFERPWWMHAAWLAWPLTALAAWLVMRRRERRVIDPLTRAA